MKLSIYLFFIGPVFIGAILIVFNICFIKLTNVSEDNFIVTQVRSRQKKFIYIDLGSNNGDSILSFFRFKPRFPELFGGNLTYENFGPEATKAKWSIYGFEANPIFDYELEQTVSIFKKHTRHKIKVFKHTAAWTYDGMITFYIENVTGFGLGSSLDKKHPDVIKSQSTGIQVISRDIASMIKNFDLSDFIVIKIDIEGAEYDLIMDFIKKDAIRWVDHFAIEFHKNLNKIDSLEMNLNKILKLYGASSSNWQ